MEIIRTIEIEEVQNGEWTECEPVNGIKRDYEKHYFNGATMEVCYFWTDAPVGFVYYKYW